MDRPFDEVLIAADAGLFCLALFGALALPDICAGMESAEGQTNEKKYIAWFDTWVAARYGGLVTGEDCYGFRCSMLHQAHARPHKGTRVMFLEPNRRDIVPMRESAESVAVKSEAVYVLSLGEVAARLNIGRDEASG